MVASLIYQGDRLTENQGILSSFKNCKFSCYYLNFLFIFFSIFKIFIIICFFLMQPKFKIHVLWMSPFYTKIKLANLCSFENADKHTKTPLFLLRVDQLLLSHIQQKHAMKQETIGSSTSYCTSTLMYSEDDKISSAAFTSRHQGKLVHTPQGVMFTADCS